MNHPARQWKLNLVASLVALSGFITLSSTLFALIHFHHPRLVSTDAHLTVIAGISLIYLATLLNRGKRNAWIVALPIYTVLVIRNLQHFIFDFPGHDKLHVAALLNLLIPLITLAALVYGRKLFNVRSEIRSFTTAIQRSLIILLVALVYGIAGFSLMDERDFRMEIPPLSAAHYTVDQFGLTTNRKIVAYSKRSHVFIDSLAVISLTAVFYTAVSLFSPIRFRLSRQQDDVDDMRRIIERHSISSEDFFMLWPPDKSYFFNQARTAAIAYRSVRGVALIVGDPAGPKNLIKNLMIDFMDFCRLNDWSPALIHAQGQNLELYQSLGFEAQKIGEEALVDTKKFLGHVATNKDFRHIDNKFTRLGYGCELLEPPYSADTIANLRSISEDWLSRSGRAERGFMLGYFSEEYLQQCNLVVARDSHGDIEAFVNLVPSPLADEANFDFLRHGSASPGNINDYLMLNFIRFLGEKRIRRLNMGLSALAGLEDATDSTSKLLNRFLNFAYANGSRFFSFKGLNRFKAKYQPEWEDRYIVYRGGIRGFSKTLNALMRAMRR